ncbi:MAG: hypothetical protein M3Q44_07830 [bacterium]|nr:hypothetical protein [bacterium]
MTGTHTFSETFTLTNAKYLASKVASDLFQMQLFYGRPTDQEINDYLGELIILLLGGYLDSVDYGFRRDNKWVIVASYSAHFGSTSSTDDRSGGVYPGANISSSTWGSYLRTNSKFHTLSQEEKDKIEQDLPIKRNGQAEPGFYGGTWDCGKDYFSGGTGLLRKMYRPS